MNGRKGNGKGRSTAQLAVRFDLSVHAFDHMFDNRQTEPGAANLARTRPIDPVEALEDPWQILVWDSDSRVRDGDLQIAAIFVMDGYANLSTRAVELDRVRQEVQERLLQMEPESENAY